MSTSAWPSSRALGSWEDWEQGRGGAALATAGSPALLGPLERAALGYTSASFDYNRAGAHMHGLVLFFDAAGSSPLRQGLLRDLTNEARRRRPSSRKTLEPARAGRTLRAPCPWMTRSPA